ncbi:S-adenosyl-L-methionine-dependent methyltransferase [Pluteus cervinus]|uniref:S-adenosyl-L-methionine-dependent methyltransferase n=1 Tax=Pluteus cervinus TaxID=181527 RepID=A0ACD3ALJ3_9AGAR|nr:S-adenosyl-L-methionine-dependent methyltransferase [Pluteus cervinus]
MPRKKKSAFRFGNKKKKKDEYRTDLLEKADMANDRFAAYYKAQGILPEPDWEEFLEAMRRALPTTFRVAGSRLTAGILNENIQHIYVPSLSDAIFEDEKIPPPVQISWYPEGLAWQFNVPKKTLRKSPEFKRFHSFLVFETEVGNISRQEAVSMLPPLFLDVEPHHRVMDMCAAPGSKTAQLLEALHVQDDTTPMPSGLLLANDSDHKRTHMLIHQSARLPSPALIVTNLDASIYPVIKIPSSTHPSGKEQLLFDRILCDVPCSGDGTIRKNVGIWKTWTPMDGNGLHGLQVRILQRAMKLLKNSGRIVYSTCSLNPVENEAVIAEALGSNAGQGFYLVDVSNRLPQLIRRPGLTVWRPTADRSGQGTHESYDAMMKSDGDDSLKAKLTEGHFPPKNADELNLTRCLRIYPHLQDTGGFFVAVLEKGPLTPLTSERERKRPAGEVPEAVEPKRPRLDAGQVNARADSMETEGAFPVRPQQPVSLDAESLAIGQAGDASFKENPYTFLQANDPILLSCIERLQLTPQFPSTNILVRNPAGDAVRSLYIANDIVRDIVQNNDYTRIRLTSAGTKVMVKQEAGRGAEAQYRILAEGLPVVLPYLDPAALIIGDLASLKTLVESYYPLCTTFQGPFREVIEARNPGGYIVRFPAGELEGTILSHDLLLPIWKSNVSITLMIDKKAKSALSLRLYGSDITSKGGERKDDAKDTPNIDISTTTGE